MQTGNFFNGNFSEISEEFIEILKSDSNTRIERIISNGNISPENFWYDQNEWEWVIVLEGSAKLEFKSKVLELNRGDWVYIPEHEIHRVIYTSYNPPCVWLAVFGKSKV